MKLNSVVTAQWHLQDNQRGYFNTLDEMKPITHHKSMIRMDKRTFRIDSRELKRRKDESSCPLVHRSSLRISSASNRIITDMK